MASDDKPDQAPSAAGGGELRRRSMEAAPWHIIISDDSPTLQDLLKRLSDPSDAAAGKVPDGLPQLGDEIVRAAERLRDRIAGAGAAPLPEEHKPELRIAIGDLLLRLLKLSYKNGIDPLRSAADRLV